MGEFASSSCRKSARDRLQVSDRLRVRGKEGRPSCAAPDKDFFKVGYEGNLGSTDDEVGGGAYGMSMTASERLFCGHQELYKAEVYAAQVRARCY